MKLKKIFILCMVLIFGCSGSKHNIKHPALKQLEHNNIPYEKDVEVNSFSQLVEALDNNKVILLDTGEYILEEVSHQNDGVTKEPGNKFFNSPTIQNLENLAIIGINAKGTGIFQSNRFEDVLVFKNVKNLHLENLIFTHSIESPCSGGVLNFQNGENITLKNIELQGSGFEGLFLDSVNNFTISNSIITRNSGQLSSFFYARDVMIENCQFVDNNLEIRGFTVYNSQVTFKNSLINESFPFLEDPFQTQRPEDVLFLIDYEYHNETAPNGLIHSRVNFINTKINEKTINHTYKNIEYTGSEDIFNPLIKFEDMVILIEDLDMSVIRDNQDYYKDEIIKKDTVFLAVELGYMPGGKILDIVDSDWKEITKIEQQLENSLAISYEGPHLDLVNWKHYTSNWSSLTQLGSWKYRIKEYSNEEMNKFPEFTKEELVSYLKSTGFTNDADYIEKKWTESYNPLYVAPSRIILKITGKNHNNKTVTKIINFLIPMGC